MSVLCSDSDKWADYADSSYEETVELVDLVVPVGTVVTAGGDANGDFYQIEEGIDQ